MDKAKSAIENFTSKTGHHETTVEEHMAPAVTQETVHQKRHEETTAAIDREVHQDHHHTTVQPITDREVLPEKHHHKVIPIEHREHHHNKDRETEERLARERAQFKDTTQEGTTTHTHSAAPAVAGEHVHHHIHENIQPVIQKETVQPHTVHTTVPIHETIHKDPQHHGSSTLNPISMSEFQKQGGTLEGRADRSAVFEGQHTNTPSAVASKRVDGPHNSDLLNKADPRVDSDRDGSRNMGLAKDTTTTGAGATGVPSSISTTGAPTGTTGTTGSGIGSTHPTGTTGTTGTTATQAGGIDPVGTSHTSKAGPPIDSTATSTGTTGSSLPGSTTGTAGTTGTTTSTTGTGAGVAGTEAKKPSLLDRLNPKKDTDGDGKAGIFS